MHDGGVEGVGRSGCNAILYYLIPFFMKCRGGDFPSQFPCTREVCGQTRKVC